MRYPYRPLKRKLKYDPQAEHIRQSLKNLYPPKEDFTLEINRKRQPKTKMGHYEYGPRHIVIYAQWGHIISTAIHEYAHHIFETERRTDTKQRPHGPGFKATLRMLEELYKQPDKRFNV